MYLLDTLYYLYKPVKRADLISVCSNVARDREKLFVMQHGKVLNQPKKGKSTHER